jgi:hypothetical protein
VVWVSSSGQVRGVVVILYAGLGAFVDYI